MFFSYSVSVFVVVAAAVVAVAAVVVAGGVVVVVLFVFHFLLVVCLPLVLNHVFLFAHINAFKCIPILNVYIERNRYGGRPF